MSAPATNYKTKTNKTPFERLAERPTSRPLAVRCYWWDMEKVLLNRGTPEARLQREAADRSLRQSRHEAVRIGWKGVIRGICLACVGGDEVAPTKVNAGTDEGPRNAIKNCGCSDCPLHPIREWKVSETLRAARKRVQATVKRSHEGVQDYS